MTVNHVHLSSHFLYTWYSNTLVEKKFAHLDNTGLAFGPTNSVINRWCMPEEIGVV